MMNHLKLSTLLVLSLLLVFSCKNTKQTASSKTLIKDDGKIAFTILQINDVYEIAPLEGGKVGGMARVATLHQQLKKENPNTLFVLAGDFLNPSLIGTLSYTDSLTQQKRKIKGQQMVEAMNVSGVDLVAFGNHEFDLKEAELQERINESEFVWIGTNVLQQMEEDLAGPFFKEVDGQKEFIPETFTWDIKDKDGTELSLGFFSATINSNIKPYVFYENYMGEAIKAYLELQCHTDLVFGLTHLALADDYRLAAKLPKIPLIMGGHEHNNMQHQLGNVMITKADANARTAYIHRFVVNTHTGEHQHEATLVNIDETIEANPRVQRIVDKWNGIMNKQILNVYPNPEEVIYQTDVPLNGLDMAVRSQQTNLGQFIATGYAMAAKQKVDAAITNGGSIRIDDQLDGDILAIDLFRVLPFGGEVWEVDISGALLLDVLKAGLVDNKGKGGYPQLYQLTYDEENNTGTINGKPIAPQQTYHIAVTDYMYWGSKVYSPLLKDLPVSKPAEDVNPTDDPRADVRIAVINYLKSLGNK